MPPRTNTGRYATMPTGTEVASYRTYEEAAAAVDVLVAADFPVASVDIVGSDLHMVESVLGKLTPARVAASGAGRGLTWGLLLAMMTMLMAPGSPVIIPMLAIVMGIVAGIVISVISWSANRGGRNFSARAQLVAGRYAILVSEQTDQAFRLLQRTEGNLGQQPKRRVRTTQASPDRPTEFGSRPDEQPKFGVRLSDRSPAPENGGARVEPPGAEQSGMAPAAESDAEGASKDRPE